MERRDFFKIAALTGAAATLDSCGSPDHQLIRFVPEETLVPGIATWKPSLCTLCPAGCGLLVRVMQGEAEVAAQGAARHHQDGAGEKARRQSHASRESRQALRTRSGRASGGLPSRSPARASEAHGRARLRRIPGIELGRRDEGTDLAAFHASFFGRRGIAGFSHLAPAWPAPRIDRALLEGVRRSSARGLRASRRSCIAPGKSPQLRLAGASHARSRPRQLRHLLRRRLPGHLELSRFSVHRLRRDAPGAYRAPRQIRAGRGPHVSRPAPAPTNGFLAVQERKVCSRSESLM